MTEPGYWIDIERHLDAADGRAEGVCRVCAEPTPAGARWCRHCRAHRAIPGVADLVVPLVYAVGGESSGRLVRDYKDHPSRTVREGTTRVVGTVVAAGLAHTACVEAAVGLPVTVRTTLPSLTFRPGVHPFQRLLAASGVVVDDVLTAERGATCHRVVTPDKFAATDPAAVAGRHVLVLDDVWTTGSSAQSAAVSLRRAGAAAVTVLVAARRLNPGYPPTARFLRRCGRTVFDPGMCPVRAGR